MEDQSNESIYNNAVRAALRGGISGMASQGINVFLLMWIRTTMNYQYRYGGSFTETLPKLYKEGGIPRFYRGILPALMQAPLSRFGDVAANEGALAALKDQDIPMAAKTMVASFCSAGFRVLLMPIDAWKTTKQVEGSNGLKMLLNKSMKHPTALWQGSLGAMSATFAGHYPWFLTNNLLRENLADFSYIPNDLMAKNVRLACIGFCSTAVSDSISNSLRVLKVNRQTSEVPLPYLKAAQNIIEAEGVMGLFGRGLKTRILANGIQGACFTVFWRTIQESLEKSGVM